MQGKIIDFVQKSEKVVVFLSVYRQVLRRDDRVIFALTDNKLRTTHFSANNTRFSLPPPIVLQVCRRINTRQTTLPHVIFCSTSYMPQPPLFGGRFLPKSNKECRFQNFSRQVARILLQFTKFCATIIKLWGHSSVGRALEWHSRGQGSDSPCLHQKTLSKKPYTELSIRLFSCYRDVLSLRRSRNTSFF